LYNICDSAEFGALHDQLASLDRHAQLTRCFSAVTELLFNSAAVRLLPNNGYIYGRTQNVPEDIKCLHFFHSPSANSFLSVQSKHNHVHGIEQTIKIT